MELKSFEEDVLGAIFVHMIPLQFVEGSLIYKKGDVADGLYLVHEGEVTVVSQKLLHQEFASLDVNQDGTLTVEEFLASEYARGLKESALQRFLKRYDPEGTGVLGLKDQNDVVNISTHVVAGHMFGYVGVFPDLARLRMDQAVAKTGVRVLFLSSENFRELSRGYPAICDKIRELCELEVSPHLNPILPNQEEAPLAGMLDFRIKRSAEAIRQEMRRTLGRCRGGNSCGAPVDVFLNEGPEDLLWRWQEGCVVAKRGGELLFFPFSREGYQSTDPRLLGIVAPQMQSMQSFHPKTSRRRQVYVILSHCLNNISGKYCTMLYLLAYMLIDVLLVQTGVFFCPQTRVL